MTTPYIILTTLFAAFMALLTGYYFGRRDGVRWMRKECAKAIERGDRLYENLNWKDNNKGKA